MAFHAIPNGGSILLPMHIPVLLCGLACGWFHGMACGAVGPLLSGILTGMPAAALLPGMMVECGAYGLVTGLMMKYIRTGKMVTDLYISMVVAMVSGRVLSGFAKAWIFTPGLSPFAWVTTSLVTGIPGIVLQLMLMPLIMNALSRARLIPERKG